MSFSIRAPSTSWEAVPLSTSPPIVVWGWFKPVLAPSTVVLQLPPELWQAGSAAQLLTLRKLAFAVGMDSLVGWTLYGQQIPLSDQTVPWLDAALPAPQAGSDQHLVLWSQPVVPVLMPTPQVMPAYSSGQALDLSQASSLPQSAGGAGDLLPGENPGPYFEMIEFYWTNILYIESDIRRARLQLEQSASKLNSLNRDLNFDELYYADSSDKQQWQDVRRWLRDASGSLSRSCKEIDIGLMSSGGQRNRFLTIYEQYVQPRIVFPGLKQTAVDFEMHHKSVKNVLQATQTALNKGSTDGERRANAVLQRIHHKARQKNAQARGKRL